jgi:hypothetical protein
MCLPEFGRCRHCRLYGRFARRGLCWSCWNRPEVRARYRRRPRRRSDTDSLVSPEMRAFIEARIAVYAERASAGLPLFGAAEPA